MTTGTPKILNIAHRGARAFAPENTLVAFAKAKTLGCDMFEMDVQMTKDGEVVVFHDEDLLRCTDVESRFPGRGSYQLIDSNYKEINQLDAGSWYIKQLGLAAHERQTFLQDLNDAELTDFVSPSEQKLYASGDIKIPTLAETLSLAKELGLMVNIELKSQAKGGQSLVAAVLGSVNKMAMESQILISSFEHGYLRQVRQQTKKIAIGVLSETPNNAPISYLRQHKASTYNLRRYQDFKLNGFNGSLGKRYLSHIDKVRKAGFDVNVWTCNNPEEMQALFTAGITGLISDYPNRVREQLAHFADKGD
jgi:glycerophosphoryl diester phosphodiesterase